MSIESQALVWAHSTATGSALLALLAIADHDGDGGAWPSMDTIAHRARVSREAARKLIRKLEDMGELSTELNGGGGRRTADHMRTNRYEITLDCPADCDRSARHRKRSEVIHTPLRAEGPPDGGVPSVRRGTPPPHGGANHPLNTPIGNSPTRSEVLEPFDRVSESDTTGSEYADWHPGEQITKARRKMIDAKQQTAPRPARHSPPPAPVVPRYDRSTEPPKPPPRSAEDDAAVAALHAIPADHPHLIPATSTICLRCGTDARTATPQGATP